MVMNGRAILAVAREAGRGATEAHWRTAVGRAYYALMLELRDAMTGWGLSLPTQNQVHQLVLRRMYVSTDTDMKQIGICLDELRRARARADYEMAVLAEFATDAAARRMIRQATDALRLFDAITAGVPRRDSIAAEIRAVLP
jgi:hypothetical protein